MQGVSGRMKNARSSCNQVPNMIRHRFALSSKSRIVGNKLDVLF